MGHAYLEAMGNSQWVETFTDGKRGNFAGIGMTYAENVATLGVGGDPIGESTIRLKTIGM